MKKFRVFIRGENFLINLDGVEQKFGFYTTRYVEAQDEVTAEYLVMDTLRDDPKLAKNVLNDKSDPPLMFAEDVEEVASFEGRPFPGTGFAFYPHEEEPRLPTSSPLRPSTSISFMEIKNSQGQIIFECDDDFRKANLDDVDLSGAMLENANLEGVVWCGTNLSRANLKAADFYWAILFTSNLSYADLEGAQFQGADLKEVNLRGANLRKANFGRDNLGGSTQLQGADLSQAQTQGAIFEGAEYDTRTVFPEFFDPVKEGMSFRPILTS